MLSSESDGIIKKKKDLLEEFHYLCYVTCFSKYLEWSEESTCSFINIITRVIGIL